MGIFFLNFSLFWFLLPLTISLLPTTACDRHLHISYLKSVRTDVGFTLCNIFSPRFHREFTQGVKPDWTISRIDHSKLLE